ncbi:MAG: phosphate signaling complex protein PhoU [Endomicrobium sp.]|jgi:phosphate transport system protein|nr:phosphate signaling complex protein PhoU [Endomicrobium sp.]
MRHFDIEINDLQNRLINMAKLVQLMIKIASKEFIKKDSQQINIILSIENEINIQEIIIDNKCLKLIALNQPVGTDLRLITSVIKINSDLERMADEAVNISKMAYDLPNFLQLKFLFINILKMIDDVQNMIMDCIKAFNTNNSQLALLVLKKDNKVDFLRDRIVDDIKSLMIKFTNIDIIQKALDLIFIAKSIERIGDHATNISEDIVFMLHGKDVRHPQRRI